MLTKPFLSQQQLVDHESLHGASSSIEEVKMMSTETIRLTTRAQTYEKSPEKKGEDASSDNATSSSSSPSSNPLTIEKLIPDIISRDPKSPIRKSMFNPSARDA